MEDATSISKKKHSLRQRKYYEKNAERIREKRREAYSADAASEYYQANRTSIRQRQRELYLQKQRENQKTRLTNLLTFAPPELLQTVNQFIAALSENIIKDSDVLALEKAVLLAGNKIIVARNNDSDDGN
jgi:hypothetical protein